MTIFLLGCGSEENKEVADVIYTNGKIYTVNEAREWADAIAIKDGGLVAVSSNAQVEKQKGDNTDVVDLEGKFVMPGVVSTHKHSIFFAAVSSCIQ